MIWIRFFCEVNAKTCQQLLSAIEGAVSRNEPDCTILMSSTGGTTRLGLAVAAHIRCLPISITAYNLGAVESVAVPLFCAADQRYAIGNSHFLFHQATWELKERLTRNQIAEKIAIMESESLHMAAAMSEATGHPSSSFAEMMNTGFVMHPEKAKAIGLIRDIANPVMPKGAGIIVIGD